MTTTIGRVRATGRGRRWLENGHPWLYANDVESEDAEPGSLVRVEAPDERVLGHGLFSAGSKIRVRLVSRGAGEPDGTFWAERAARAVAHRRRHGFLDPRAACRLIAGDADGFPGWVLDRYADALVVQSGTLAGDRLRDEWLALVERELGFPITTVIDRSESSLRRFENLGPRTEVVRGAPTNALEIVEDELRYTVDLVGGHKTGHYLDQRDNRKLAARHARDARVLDVFSYDGLFGIRAALAGARSVLCLDQSEAALERARENAARNGVADRVATERVDALRDLRERAKGDARFELVVVDPPAFARNKTELEGAERGYRELNLRALRLLEPAGVLVSASCSYAVLPALFVEWLARAASDAGREVWLEALAGASLDHPHLVTLPESAYLKCAFLRVGGNA
ncbi:MAG: class I SAM-dependent rRNA methyltransferase [Planctomycetes bacterium]|nr:class I SAM-dependent rRNA methyltransferase [Planctomycetota bacterium]